MRENSKWMETLNQMLGADFVLTEAALQTVIDDELQKDDDQMDMDFIDFCTDLLIDMQDGKLVTLTGGNTGSQSSAAEAAPSNIVLAAEQENSETPEAPVKEVKKKKRRHIGRTLLIAAVLTALLSCTLLVSANKEGYKLNTKLASFVEGVLKVDLSDGKVTPENYTPLDSALMQELANNGFTDIVLPRALLEGEWAVSEVTYQTQELMKTAIVEISDKDTNDIGSIIISRYIKHMNPKGSYLHISNVSQFEVNGLDVTALECENGQSNILYSDMISLTEYLITLPQSLDKAIEIALTL